MMAASTSTRNISEDRVEATVLADQIRERKRSQNDAAAARISNRKKRARVIAIAETPPIHAPMLILPERLR